MNTFKLDEQNYHISNLSKKEYAHLKELLNTLYKKDPKLNGFIFDTFKNNNEIFSPKKNNFIYDILAGFVHSLKDEELAEDKYYEKLIHYFYIFLPEIFNNISSYKGSHLIQYEPKTVILIGLSNYIVKEFSSSLDRSELEGLSEYEQYYDMELINLFRCLKSSLLLFSIGDDVHGISLYRGFIEIMCKLILAVKNKDDYVKYKKYNVYLQVFKSGGDPLPDEMVKELKDHAMDETYICYAWIKNNKGKRITTLKGMIKEAFKEIKISNLDEFYHYSSEFVHEDYVGVGYNYIVLRNSYVSLYYYFLQLLEEACTDASNDTKRFFELMKKI